MGPIPPPDDIRPAGPDSVQWPTYVAHLEVFSDALTLAELTHILGQPSRGYDAGDPVSKRHPEGPTRKKAHWWLASDLDSTQPLDKQIEGLVAFAEQHADALREVQTSSQVVISCAVFRGDFAVPTQHEGWTIIPGCGFTLGADLMGRLAALQLPVTVDIS